MSPPNILLVFSDQQRWDTVGCYGQPLGITPNLDHMAEEGVRFEHAFTCQPVCGPARSTLQTGKYPAEIGVFTNHRMLPIDEKAPRLIWAPGRPRQLSDPPGAAGAQGWLCRLLAGI